MYKRLKRERKTFLCKYCGRYFEAYEDVYDGKCYDCLVRLYKEDIENDVISSQILQGLV